ncbi:MAG TPA: hypothetical protein VM120_04575 [Bryobacteraceae bacterium]|nr:hypothetical protein [Bryobacteraceae bacterium]
MISRRDFFGVTVGLIPIASLRAQDIPPPVRDGKIVVQAVVTDGKARYINGLKASDFRIFEDGILQKISTFSEGNKPAVETGRDPLDPEARTNAAGSVYTITYSPDPSNQNEGFRKIRIEIVTDTFKRWRVRARPGYRPERRIP